MSFINSKSLFSLNSASVNDGDLPVSTWWFSFGCWDLVGQRPKQKQEATKCGLTTCQDDCQSPTPWNRGRKQRSVPAHIDSWQYNPALETWNISTLAGKIFEIVCDVERYQLDIAGLIWHHDSSSSQQFNYALYMCSGPGGFWLWSWIKFLLCAGWTLPVLTLNFHPVCGLGRNFKAHSQKEWGLVWQTTVGVFRPSVWTEVVWSS